jgi:hypothetical protein
MLGNGVGDIITISGKRIDGWRMIFAIYKLPHSFTCEGGNPS